MPTLPIGTWAIWFVHFARCNEEQRRIQTAARIREAGRKTDLSVELNDTRGTCKKNLSGVSAKKNCRYWAPEEVGKKGKKNKG